MANNPDIFNLLATSEEKKSKRERTKILKSLGVHEEYFIEGDIRIDMSTCRGVECELCIKACPTNALFWSEAKIKIEKDLCIYCGACVLSCIVDDCIQIHRKRPDGAVEEFSAPRATAIVINNQSAKKRREAIRRRAFWKEYIE